MPERKLIWGNFPAPSAEEVDEAWEQIKLRRIRRSELEGVSPSSAKSESR
jgi:hypothetical protein